MIRYKITLEYDGTDLVGWQRQDNGPSIQQSLEEAIEKFVHQPTRVYGSGRTDAGVHACGQVAHFDLPAPLTPHRIREAINYHVQPKKISVLSVEAVCDDFHARFSARERSYRYRILNRAGAPALDRKRAWHIKHTLDREAMHKAAQHLVGHHDFTTFRASECQAASPQRTLNTFKVSQEGDSIYFDVVARSFLHHQVRNMVGALKLVGEGKWSESDVLKALKAKDRRQGGPTAPAEGLYLMHIGYENRD